MEIELLKADGEKNWDEYLATSPYFRFSETANFKNVLEKTYNYKPYYLVIKKDNEPIALLPAILKNNKLISMPFSDYGDLIKINPSVSPAEIVQALKNFLQEEKIDYLKIISGLNIQASHLKEYFEKEQNDTRAVLTLEDDPAALLKKFDYSVRKAIKKAQSANLKCHQDSSPEAIKNHFYPLYLKSMKRLGTPPHSLSYFLNKQKYLANNLKLFIITKNNTPIAALLGFTSGKNIHITKNPSDQNLWNLRPNDLAHWEFIKWGCENEYETFDFGPVRYESQKRYKEKWGAKIQDNYIFYLFPENTQPKLPNLKTHSPGLKLLSLLWKHLIPLSITPYLGPIIRKRLGK